MQRAKQALQNLSSTDSQIYKAAAPGYPNNFSRDSFTYGLLADDLEALEAQVAFSASHQGVKYDPVSGEEPGKIHHEFPGVALRGLMTTYNACDTTALFLLAIAYLVRHGKTQLLVQYAAHIDQALSYILAHTIDGLFTEDPSACGASRFALKVTYWKDSELHTSEREPTYPIAYSLVHFQNKAAVQEMGHLLHRYNLLDKAWYMTFQGLMRFWRDDHFIIAIDNNDRIIDSPSSDSLHILFYLEPHEIDDQYPAHIVSYSEQLATDAGYLPALQPIEGLDPYHIEKVWVHEQALLHAAARRHHLSHAEQVAARVIRALEREGFPELVEPTTLEHAGNSLQLWSIGAYTYFQRLEAELVLDQQFRQHTPTPPKQSRAHHSGQ